MMPDEEPAGTRCPTMEIKPEKFRPLYSPLIFYGRG